MRLAVASALLDSFPRQYCGEVKVSTFVTNSHEVTFWNGTSLDYNLWRKRWGGSYSVQKSYEAVEYFYHWCTGSIQPRVLERDFDGMPFTMDDFAAMTHNNDDDTLVLTIGNETKVLTRCYTMRINLPK
mmetsp:Transcript_21459/g.17841  ORF Transcript_21459/g.17841 Transcript_21459/m.17841 type:complete len:129 (-) Transcript_21459:61-447(-)